MSHTVRRSRDVHRPAHASFFGGLHAAHWNVVVRHQKILAQKEIQFARRENAILPAVIHTVDHHEKVSGKFIVVLGRVLLYLRGGADSHAVLDRERMEMEYIYEDKFLLSGSGLFQVDPEKEVRVRQEGRHEEHFYVRAVQASLSGEYQ